MPSFGPLQVYVMSVDTETILQEYKVVASGRKTECWIESKEGLHFCVNMFVTPNGARLKSSEAFRFKIYVDGQLVGSCFLGYRLQPWRWLPVLYDIARCSSYRKGTETIQVCKDSVYRYDPASKGNL